MPEEKEYRIFLTEEEALYFTNTGSDYDSWIIFIGTLQKIRRSICAQMEENINLELADKVASQMVEEKEEDIEDWAERLSGDLAKMKD